MDKALIYILGGDFTQTFAVAPNMYAVCNFKLKDGQRAAIA